MQQTEFKSVGDKRIKAQKPVKTKTVKIDSHARDVFKYKQTNSKQGNSTTNTGRKSVDWNRGGTDKQVLSCSSMASLPTLSLMQGTEAIIKKSFEINASIK